MTAKIENIICLHQDGKLVNTNCISSLMLNLILTLNTNHNRGHICKIKYQPVLKYGKKFITLHAHSCYCIGFTMRHYASAVYAVVMC